MSTAPIPQATARSLDTPDGARLSVLDLVPARRPRALVIAGHAMMVDRRTLFREDRPSLVGALLDAGLRVMLPDLRGHGESQLDGSWCYDDLVSDTGVYVAHARQQAPELPLVLLGHSLFGHTSLAWAGAHPEAPIAAQVLLSVGLWLRGTNRNTFRRWVKRAVVEGATRVAARTGRVPARRLGLGTADEPLEYFRCFLDHVRHDRWRSRGGIDYAANMGRIGWPVLQVVSPGDRWLAAPDEALRFTAALPRREVMWLGPRASRPALRPLRPGHMQLVTSPRCTPAWQAVASWILARLD